ncbi:unnamed protein product [Vitrella brassicaformis CCMP3155]|uniref:Uncharacterized protein n=2 Tax=Vitrella brassicaformis TaxID=1169539 RepID=A0A0G4G1R7_VITBC|nr:unnamed protein product [Vitrella brassicaformis CCMP3155]|eukprot:CEM21900.1 unnamed protein product [Vitrella brassicaformis CCMP3155]
MPSVLVDATASPLYNEEAPHTDAPAPERAPPVQPFDFFGLNFLLSKPKAKVEGADFYAFILTHQLLFLVPVAFASYLFYSRYIFSQYTLDIDQTWPFASYLFSVQYIFSQLSYDNGKTFPVYDFGETVRPLIMGLSIGTLVLLALCCWPFFKRMSVLAPRSGAQFPHRKAGWQLTTHIIQLILLSSLLPFLPWFDVFLSEILYKIAENFHIIDEWVYGVVAALFPIGVVGLRVLLFGLVTRFLGLYAISGENATALAMAWGTVYSDTMRCVAVPFLSVVALSATSLSLLWLFGLAGAFCMIVVLIRLVLSLFVAAPAKTQGPSRGCRLSAACGEQSYV